MNNKKLSLQAASEYIPHQLLDQSGKVFYSGKKAFSARAKLYILGVNPGGDPNQRMDETIGSHTDWVLNKAPVNWSAYRDESWKGKPPGQHGMQPRILHMCRQLNLDPGSVPSSNLVFVRSRREGDLSEHLSSLPEECWPFHEYVLKTFRPEAVLCLGRTAGDFLRDRLGAPNQTDEFVEQNARRWRSCTYSGSNGPRVVIATHPSIADWTNPATDPTPLIKRALNPG